MKTIDELYSDYLLRSFAITKAHGLYFPLEERIIGFHLPSEPYGCFSNWYLSDFSYAGRTYVCVEQYMMVQKVEHGNRFDLSKQIMETSDPAVMKDLAGKEHFKEYSQIKDWWERNRRYIVKRALKAKFCQNAELQRKLLETRDALLCECAGQDKVWGIGINLKHEDQWKDINNWKGDNNLGIALMEVREELKQELSENGSLKYIDYKQASPINEWMNTAKYLKRIPQYYRAIHAYSDQMHDVNLKQSFYQSSLNEVEFVIQNNNPVGYPISGFYEMKQDIFEISKRTHRCRFVGDLMLEYPERWGLRGDLYFWEDLKALLVTDNLSISENELAAKVKEYFEKKTGKTLNEEVEVYVEEYDHGGMSSGAVSGKWVLNTCIPTLQKRLKEAACQTK